MVLNERNSEMVRNGRRSRGPSPNGVNTGTHTPESSDDDNSIKRNGKSKTKQSEYEEKIRVGRDYQAICPPLIPDLDRKPETLADRALLVWSPTKEIADKSLEEYIKMAKEQYGYNGEQALGMLFWHKHDLPRAISDLSNFTPFPDEWTTEDKVLFEQAFQFHGKSFHRIRQMLPDKSIASLVKYYYSWKKTRHRVSAMDRQEKKAAAKDSGNGSDNGSENGSNEDSETEENNKVQINKQLIEMKNVENNDDLRPAEASNRINARWTNEETMLAVNGVKQYGKDFQAIADILGTKTKAHVQTFYVNYRRRYNLDQLVKEYEARIAAEKADSVSDDVKEEKKDEKVTSTAASTANESSSTEEKAVESKQPTETSKSSKTESNSISVKRDVMEMSLDKDVEDNGEPPSKKLATNPTTKSQEENPTS